MKRIRSIQALRCLIPAAGGLAALLGNHLLAHDAEPVEFSPIGIPYAWHVELSANESTHTGPAHVGAWSWDEDSFPETAKGWTHTSAWVQLDLIEPVALTLTLESADGVPWPSAADPARLAGTNLFPSFTLYRGWDTDAGTITNTDGTTLDQDHTFNNRGNIAWAEDVTYLDHLDNATAHSATRTWVLPAGRHTVNLGGNSPAVVAEGRQGYKATFTTKPVSGPIANAVLRPVDFNAVGIPYGWSVQLGGKATAQTLPDHVGAWSWDEDSFPETAKGWTHTSRFVQLELTEASMLTLVVEGAAGVPWPGAAAPTRLAGTNLFPSFTLYRGWDTDAGTITNADGTTLDQDHTFNNRGNIAWAEDVTYLDHLDNSKLRQVSRTWSLPAGRYTVNLGGNSPATLAEGRQGIRATFSTAPATGFTLESHSALQAVNEQGVSTWTGTHPFVLTGVLLNNPEDFVDATPGFLPFTPANTFQLGGQWQVFFQSVDPADRGGTAGWMGQNYGNLPFIRDTDASYPDAEWTSEIQRLSHDPANGHRFRQGDLIRVIANRTLDFAGKRNVNEAHERSPDANWHIELVEANYGLPAPEVVSLSQLVRPDDGNPATSEAIFDATRQTGPEHWQSMRIRINGLSLADASGWGKNPFFERVCIATDGAGRSFRLRMPRLDLGTAPQGRFDAIGILDQDSGSGVDGTTGYELFVQSIVRTAPVLSILRRDSNSMTLAWPTGSGLLRRTDRIGGDWVAAPGTPTTEGENQVLTVPVGDGQAFYRLD